LIYLVFKIPLFGGIFDGKFASEVEIEEFSEADL